MQLFPSSVSVYVRWIAECCGCYWCQGLLMCLFLFLVLGSPRSASRVYVMLCSTSALLRLGTQSRHLVAQSVPSPCPLIPQQCKTCRPTLPIGTPAEGRHTYIQYTPWWLKTIKSAYTWVCSALTYSVLPLVSWHNAGLRLVTSFGPTRWPVTPGIKRALAPLWNIEHGCWCVFFVSGIGFLGLSYKRAVKWVCCCCMLVSMK